MFVSTHRIQRCWRTLVCVCLCSASVIWNMLLASHSQFFNYSISFTFFLYSGRVFFFFSFVNQGCISLLVEARCCEAGGQCCPQTLWLFWLGFVCAKWEMEVQHGKSFCHIIPSLLYNSNHYSGVLAAAKHIQCFWQGLSETPMTFYNNANWK